MDVTCEAHQCLVRSLVGDYKASWTAVAKNIFLNVFILRVNVFYIYESNSLKKAL